MEIEVTGIEAQVCREIAQRQQMGIAKYGAAVADNPLSLIQWVRHAKEEAMDLAIYLTRVEAKLMAMEDDGK